MTDFQFKAIIRLILNMLDNVKSMDDLEKTKEKLEALIEEE